MTEASHPCPHDRIALENPFVREGETTRVRCTDCGELLPGNYGVSQGEEPSPGEYLGPADYPLSVGVRVRADLGETPEGQGSAK